MKIHHLAPEGYTRASTEHPLGYQPPWQYRILNVEGGTESVSLPIDPEIGAGVLPGAVSGVDVSSAGTGALVADTASTVLTVGVGAGVSVLAQSRA